MKFFYICVTLIKNIYVKNFTPMLFQFFQKQKDVKQQKQLIQTMVVSLNIDPEQKKLYLEALEVLTYDEAAALYKNLTRFIEMIEMKEIEDIRKDSFASIAGMRKKEAEEKIQEINSFSFLFHNL